MHVKSRIPPTFRAQQGHLLLQSIILSHYPYMLPEVCQQGSEKVVTQYPSGLASPLIIQGMSEGMCGYDG